MAHFLDWFLIGWTLVSAIATPFVGRFVANALTGPDGEKSATANAPVFLVPHEAADR